MGYKLKYHILVLPNQVLLINRVLTNEVLLYSDLCGPIEEREVSAIRGVGYKSFHHIMCIVFVSTHVQYLMM
jgi:hypothetical protein